MPSPFRAPPPSSRAALTTFVTIALLAFIIGSLRLWPGPSLRAGIPRSAAISAQGGELLRLTLAPDGQYRLWVELEQMPPRLPAAVLLYEDRWFYQHPGVNPIALLRAAFGIPIDGRRIGASTITMQLARRLYGLDSRNPIGKLRQIAGALWLEARYSKHDILETYLNVAPYGGNVEGVGAASLVFFGHPVAGLSVPEVMTLAVVPQNPRARRIDAGSAAQADTLGRANGNALAAARGRLWERWLAAHPGDGRFAGDMAAKRIADRAATRTTLPFLAPHFTDAVLRQFTDDVHTTLSLSRQRTLERVLHSYVGEQSAIGIRNGGALLLEMRPDGAAAVRAYVGSADYRDAGIDGQVNAVTAKRSPGSALKPFVYALALDQGLLHPRTILKDTPSSFGPFSPENFDGRFVGPIAAEDALIRSRNVPAVAVASQLSHPDLYDFLKAGGVSRLDSERHYGLALALGGGEVSMEELGRLYAILLNGGLVPRLQYLADSPMAHVDAGERLLSEEASFITLDMLDKNPRPDTGQPATPAVAWKTGTSWGFHDAWSAGIFGRYVLIVWIGNFDNTSNPAFVGVQAAAPLLFRMIDALRGQGLAPIATRSQPGNVARVEVCAASGDLPNAECPQTVPTWYIPGKSPIRVSDLHRRIFIDAAGRQACGAGPGIHTEVFEFWTSDLLRLFREAGMPRRVPPASPDCATPSTDLASGRDAPQIVSPLRGVAYTLRAGHAEPLALRATIAARAQTIYWFADNAFVGRATQGDTLAWLPAHPGHYLLRAVDDSGAADTRDIDVESLP
jgi:penicillin-binding protein 1C